MVLRNYFFNHESQGGETFNEKDNKASQMIKT